MLSIIHYFLLSIAKQCVVFECMYGHSVICHVFTRKYDQHASVFFSHSEVSCCVRRFAFVTVLTWKWTRVH